MLHEFRKLCLGALVCLISVAINAVAYSADWPQFRADANRSAATDQELPGELHLQWQRQFPKPQPAFPGEVRLRYDASYEPVVKGKMIFVPSMVTHTVSAFNTDSGEQQWVFFTEGPVRFAPVAWKDKLFFVSDDGYLYCVDARKGTLHWKFRGLPAGKEDRKLLGNQRLISLWPARGGPVLANGVIYFAAGIWPEKGIFVHALDAATGKTIWSNTDSHHLAKANLDHGVNGHAGITPQGYLALVGDLLLVPCGAQLPAFLNRKTGKLVPYTMGWGGRVGLPKGSWFISGKGRYLSHSGDLYDMETANQEKFKDPRNRNNFKPRLYPGGFTRIQIEPTNQRALGEFRMPVLTDSTMYSQAMQADPKTKKMQRIIAAFDLSKPNLTTRNVKTDSLRRNDKYPDKTKGVFPTRWSLPSNLKVQIKVGSRIFATGGKVIEAIDIPKAGGKAKVGWRTEIEGTPTRVLAADDKLFVVSDQGWLYAFAKTPVSKARPFLLPRTAEQADAKPKNANAPELGSVKARAGFALVLGLSDGKKIEQLLAQSELHVVAIDSDLARVDTLRRHFHKAGQYGTRVTILQGDPLKMNLPPYFADLVISEDASRFTKSLDADALKSIHHSLHPYGGRAVLEIPVKQRAGLEKQLKDLPFPGPEFRANTLYLIRSGGLPGADDWSHDQATAGNAGATQDMFLKPPLGILWFDGTIRWHRKLGAAILRVSGGRILVLAEQIHAFDAYTGRKLWVRDTPMGRGKRSERQIVALADRIYLVDGATVHVLSASDGRSLKDLKMPKPLGAAKWSGIRILGNYLVATAGANLLCLDRETGKLIWNFTAAHGRLSVALGEDKVFLAEIDDARRGQIGGRTFAFDIKSGQELWRIKHGAQIRYSGAHQMLVSSRGVFKTKDGSTVRKAKLPAWVAGDFLIGSTEKDHLAVYDLLKGDEVNTSLKWNRRGCTNMRASSLLATTRFQGNAAYIDLDTRKITPLWNMRSGCNNNLVPANGLLNVTNLTGGCECNYTPTSMSLAPLTAIRRPKAGR